MVPGIIPLPRLGEAGGEQSLAPLGPVRGVLLLADYLEEIHDEN